MRSVLLAALIMALALMSGLIDINIEHHMNLPKEFTNKNVIDVDRNLLGSLIGQGKNINITVADTIESQNSIRDMVKVLRQAKENDVIVFHISGYGGTVDTVELLINNILLTKAHVKMVVEAPSYSGHAYLATVGHELEMMPYSYLMFHTSSGYGFDCSTPSDGYDPNALDRAVPMKEHCEMYMDNHLLQMNKLIWSIKFLTDLEKFNLTFGHDVYITSEEYYKRMGVIK